MTRTGRGLRLTVATALEQPLCLQRRWLAFPRHRDVSTDRAAVPPHVLAIDAQPHMLVTDRHPPRVRPVAIVAGWRLSRLRHGASAGSAPVSPCLDRPAL